MHTYNLSDEELKQILDTARYAPSVHNTQPWRVKKVDELIEISIDPNHKLGPGDPTGRETIISMGIFAEAVCLTAGITGLQASVRLDKDKALIIFKKGKKSDKNWVKLLKSRATDRSIYKKTRVNFAVKKTIEKCTVNKAVKIRFIDDQHFIRFLARLTAKGISLALSNPDFRQELRKYLLRPWSHKKRGISVRSLYLPSFIALLQPDILRLNFSSGKESQLEERRWLSASAVIMVTTEGDLHDDWFAVGRTYMRISLEIERAGLSQATSAATVEAATFHEDIEKMLGTSQRLQVAIRIGKGAAKRHYSPRVSVEELIAT
ncbi:MAG TPA: nitroreductase family protein [Candidatus Saccharimonadales bacterium]|nr:nitroreductase family protein [Candidatus Saccharimonadales bacterium]